MASLKVTVSQLILGVLLAATGTYGKPPSAIVGGEIANDNEFPYQVSLRQHSQHICGGSILDSTHIVTAAHCVEGGNSLIYSMTVVTGTNSLSSGGQTHRIRQVTIHPAYSASAETSWRNDIAVITLQSAIALNSRSQPIRLPSRNPADGMTAVSSGWGNHLYVGGPVPDQLRKLVMNLLSQSQCRMHIGPLFDSHLCAFARVGSGVCTGDSGGPLVINGELVGVTSWVIPCALGYPDVFTNVYKFASWIRGVMQTS